MLAETHLAHRKIAQIDKVLDLIVNHTKTNTPL